MEFTFFAGEIEAHDSDTFDRGSEMILMKVQLEILGPMQRGTP